MNKKLRQILITAIILIPLAFSARAYTAPTASDKAGNTDVVPIYLNATPQVKNGDLALGGTFFVQGNALFNQNLYLKGTVMGALPVAGSSATASTVNLGSSADHSSVVVYGETTTATKFQSDNLIHTGGLKPICADANGKIILCDGSGTVTPPSTPPPTTCSMVSITPFVYSNGQNANDSVDEVFLVSPSVNFNGIENLPATASNSVCLTETSEVQVVGTLYVYVNAYNQRGNTLGTGTISVFDDLGHVQCKALDGNQYYTFPNFTLDGSSRFTVSVNNNSGVACN
jgi:hypothetical protein